MILRSRGWAALLLGFALVGKSSATTYYVSSSGNDANNGTSPTTAWKNAPGMAEYTGSGTLKPGDTVYFDRGDTWLVNGARGLWLIGGVTYIGDTWGTGTRATIRSAVSNDAGVVSFRDDVTKLTIFQGFEVDANHTISSGIDLGHRYPILLTGATKRINNVVVHGVSSNASAGQYKYGIIMSSWPLSGTCSYTKGGSGAAGNVANVEVLNSKVYDISRTGIALYPGPCDGLEGIKNITVRGNEVYNTGTDAGTTGYGILTKGNVQDAYIEYNYVHDTSLAGVQISAVFHRIV